MLSAIGAIVAVVRELPGAPFGVETGLSAGRDFLFGLGTALSAPVALLLAFVVTLTMVLRRTPVPRSGLLLTAAFALAFFAGVLVEPHTWDVVNDATGDPAMTVLVTADALVPAYLARIALRAASGRLERAPGRS